MRPRLSLAHDRVRAPLEDSRSAFLRGLHRASASVLLAFACVHIANHLASLASIDAHLAFMEAARRLYRHRIAEPILLTIVAIQAATGLTLVVRGWHERRGRVAWLQAASGAYLALFLVFHLAAVLLARAVLHLDTNFYFAAAGLHVWPYVLFFAPYYFLAVVALFLHLGCAACRVFDDAAPSTRRALIVVPLLAGVVVSSLIVLSLAGLEQPFRVPAEYKATFIGG